jgi:tRNA nucleotidyltransferase (CCA-adding enzyme)
MDNFASVVNHVLPSITPSPTERGGLTGLAGRVTSMLNKALISKGIRGVPVVGGSFARGTFLKGAHDVDFFIRFANKKDLDQFPKLILSAFPDAHEVMGSRKYYKARIDNYELEFIPTLLIKDPVKAENSMDASFFHIEYVNARLNDSLRQEVLLLKQFCKACGVYGAESHIRGFSGYVIELLILHFGGFKKFLEFINNSSHRLFIDIEGYYDSMRKAFTALKVDKLTPVVIVDPVLPTRNAAAGLSMESFSKFVLKTRLFLMNPSQSFFKTKSRSVSDLRDLASKRGHPLFTHKFEIKGKPDVFFAKLGRSLSKVKATLEKEEFTVHDYGFLNNGTVFFELEHEVLSLSRRVLGPPVTIAEEHFKNFVIKKAIHGPYIFNGRVCFDVKREHTRAKPLLMKLLREIS